MLDFSDIALFSLFSSDGDSGGWGSSRMGISNAERRRRNREFESGNYNLSAQYRYEHNHGDFNVYKVMDALHKDYPGMTMLNAYEIAEMAIAKRRMEEETPYKYFVQHDYRFMDLEKYASDEFKCAESEDEFSSSHLGFW